MRTSLTARSLAGGPLAARARVPRVVSRGPVGSSGTSAAAARWTRPGAPLPRTRVLARAELKSGGEGRFVRPVEDKSPRADDDIYWDPADLDDEPPAMQFDFDDDDDDDDEDDWFFVPEGAMGNVKDAEEDLFIIGEDYDDDESFGFAEGFVDFGASAGGDDDVSNSANRAGNRSNRRRARKDIAKDAGDSNARGGGGEQAELTPKQVEEQRKREEDTVRMLKMGVPEKLLRRLEDEKAAVESFNVRKKAENARRTHKRLSIVAGTFARRKILSPSGLDTRPMMGMVRGATFDMIMSLIGSRSNTAFPEGSRWLDLFAGTGAIGIEALSRGAAEAHFVEMDPWVTGNVLNKNIKTLGIQSRTRVHTAKVENFLSQHKNSAKAAGGAFDFVSFCPPYYKVSYPELLAQLDQSPLIADHTVVLVEYARSQKPEMTAAIGKRLRRVRDRRYGRTYVAIYVCDGRELPDEDDEWAEQPEEATKFGKVVRGGAPRD